MEEWVVYSTLGGSFPEYDPLQEGAEFAGAEEKLKQKRHLHFTPVGVKKWADRHISYCRLNLVRDGAR